MIAQLGSASTVFCTLTYHSYNTSAFSGLTISFRGNVSSPPQQGTDIIGGSVLVPEVRSAASSIRIVQACVTAKCEIMEKAQIIWRIVCNVRISELIIMIPLLSVLLLSCTKLIVIRILRTLHVLRWLFNLKVTHDD